MGAKLASRNTGMTKEAKPELTDAQKLQEIRNLRAGHLAVLNGEYVDALLRLYDEASKAAYVNDALIEQASARIVELHSQLKHIMQERDDLRAALTQAQVIVDSDIEQ